MIGKAKSRFMPVIAALGLALTFTSMGVWIRMMQDSFTSWQQVYLRILLAGLIAAVVFRKQLGKGFWSSLDPKEWVIYSVRAILGYAVGVGLFTIAIQETPLATVSFVSSLPIMGVLGWLIFREKVDIRSLPFIALSVAGLVLLTGFGVDGFQLSWGVTAAIISMFGFDIGYLLSRYHKKSRTNYQNTTLLLLIAWLPAFGISLIAGEALPDKVSLNAWIGLFMSSLLNIVVLLLTNYVFSNLKAYVAGNLLLTEGIFALILGFALYGERLSVFNCSFTTSGTVIMLIF